MSRWVVGQAPLLNEVAVVTGASSGIGRATALALAEKGAHVSLGARTESALHELADEIRVRGREALVVPTDVTDKNQVNRLVTETLARFQRVNILVANAGAYIRSPIRALTIEEIRRSMAVNFYGALHAVLAVQSHMLEQGDGHIILVSSLDGKKGLPQDAPYVAAKFALAGYGEVLRQELYGSGVHVTTVFPGRVDTPLIDTLEVPRVLAKIPAEAVARSIVAAVRRPKPEVIMPIQGRALHLVNALSPRLGDWLVRLFHLQGWERG